MKKPNQPPSQVVDLLWAVAEALGLRTDRELAQLAQVVPDNVANWRQGTVREFKAQTLEAIKAGVRDRIRALAASADLARDANRAGLHAVIVEAGSGPDELLTQFRERIAFDYLGHRFLYYEPQGALAWLHVLQTGYDQDAWLAGTEAAATDWASRAKDATGRCKGPIAQALGLEARGHARTLEVIGLGSGDGGKEVAVTRELMRAAGSELDDVTFAPVDVSIPLLLRAAAAAHKAFDAAPSGAPVAPPGAVDTRRPTHAILPFCADFEEGPLTFLGSLPSAARAPERTLRLVLLLGNVFGNLRDEDRFVRHKLWRMTRPGDLVWIELALRLDPLTEDPLYRMTEARDEAETAAEASRRMLLEGPLRRWEAALGRQPAKLGLRVFVRQDDDTARVPGSCNFCHDLLLLDERRACTMLFSRRYALEGLIPWLEEREFAVERVHQVRDSKRRSRIAHLLLRRR